MPKKLPTAVIAGLLVLASSCTAWPFLDQTLGPTTEPHRTDPSDLGAIVIRDDDEEEYDVVDNSMEGGEAWSDGELSGHLEHLEGRLFGSPSNETGARVDGWHEGLGVNPEELGEYAEGDILYPLAMARNGVKAESARWPNGVVPFVISPYFNEQQQRVIREAMLDYHKHTCVKFKPYAGEESDYLRITAGKTGCWSSVGRMGGRQDLNLQVPGCVARKGTVIHELMHVVGFLHEQSRHERDQYVSVQWQNINPGRESNFEKSRMSTTEAFGIGYDYGSVMHYSARAFSRNGQPTIIPKTYSIDSIGQREGFSVRDIKKIRRMYRCSSRRRHYGANL
ncbi:zinc metalloproteinase nas-13-like [Copidosoma floridanum]|uniref:zinc metalloproteinase nas-13-like n=1 Tax=Copidosoma floridanum TaxID=29053 RepID=UPI0006C974A8|nr:zinc metalloproteinase nas-13-like [Copidosoma floridanum]